MVEISMFGSGEGLVWATGRGYSTTNLFTLRAKVFHLITQIEI